MFRDILMETQKNNTMLLVLILCLTLIVFLTRIIIKFAERHNRITGDLQIY